MKTTKLRTLSLGDRVTSLRFTPEEWVAIEAAAKRSGQTWTDWARHILTTGKRGGSQTSLLRRAAMEEIYAESMLAERMDDLAAAREFDHPMLRHRFWALDSEALASELELWEITRRVEFTAFELIVGFRDGTPAIVVRSRLEGDLHTLLFKDARPDAADESGDVGADLDER